MNSPEGGEGEEGEEVEEEMGQKERGEGRRRSKKREGGGGSGEEQQIGTLMFLPWSNSKIRGES